MPSNSLSLPQTLSRDTNFHPASLSDVECTRLPEIRQDWYERGITERNCGLFSASLYPIRDWLRQQASECLGSNMKADSVTLSLLVDDAILLAFEASADWAPVPPSLDWIADFIPQAIHEFEFDHVAA
ncbi:hypothetical protein [Fuerstiella marisgermanici]|uniref:Uncharacterized protein n=1 Tax=Fuerstiella marisgermanici TaxID=1891926 RepID=A0A1P8WCL0_9PLAN|nr:hypothetical protein [Fuerstiella marisgermanici]APZ91805.1 hypothetical protein Fuma_01399 [Fuerstiella marisgermanici]